jgi:hypothetical protein
VSARAEIRAELHRALDAALDAAELELRSGLVAERLDRGPRTEDRPRATLPPTSLQMAQGRLRELVRDVIEGCSEDEARAWFPF